MSLKRIYYHTLSPTLLAFTWTTTIVSWLTSSHSQGLYSLDSVTGSCRPVGAPFITYINSSEWHLPICLRSLAYPDVFTFFNDFYLPYTWVSKLIHSVKQSESCLLHKSAPGSQVKSTMSFGNLTIHFFCNLFPFFSNYLVIFFIKVKQVYIENWINSERYVWNKISLYPHRWFQKVISCC